MWLLVVAIIGLVAYAIVDAYAGVIMTFVKIIGIGLAVIGLVVVLFLLARVLFPVLIVVGLIALVRWKQKKKEKEKQELQGQHGDKISKP